MRLGLVGLGRMGAGVALNAIGHGHEGRRLLAPTPRRASPIRALRFEFGMVQAIGEGVEMLERSDLPALFENGMHGSVIRSWLVDLMGKALAEHPDRSGLSTYVEAT